MTFAARAWLLAALVVALGNYGGEGDLVRPLMACAVAVGVVLAVFTLRREFHPPPVAWIALLFLPLIALTALQVLPLGWHHPWLDEDLAALGTTQRSWSIDPAASYATLVWLATLAGFALTVCLLARGERLMKPVDALLYLAAVTAVFGLALMLTGSTWPSEHALTRVRGPFIYPNHAAAFWAACLPLATFSAHRRRGALRWGTVAVLALAILLSGSRGGILVAALVMLPIAVGLLPRERRWWWATGGGVLVLAWLWLIGVGDVTGKFERLRGDEGATFNGRTLIWQAALPVIQDAGALGSGAGTTIPAYRRSGDPHFADALVNHLHSDPLEWWLEYGWIGVLVAIATATAVLVRLRPHLTAWQDPSRRTLIIGAAAGVVILMLHSCGDFIWHNPVVAMTGVALLCVVALAGAERRRDSRPRAHMRMTAGLIAGMLLVGAWSTWDWYVSDLWARDAERLVFARASAHLPLTGAEVIEQARAITPASVRLAGTQAWLAHAAGDLDAARAACARAARLAPGDAALWAQRALLAAESGDAPATTIALRRALVWAPAWPDIQQIALRLIAGHGRGLLPPEQTIAIVAGILAADRAQPAWFFPLADEVLGRDRLLEALRSAGSLLSRSAEDWLARAAPVADWVALRQRLATPSARLPAGLALAYEHLLPDTGWQPVIPLEVEDRRALADQLATAGLPVPAALVATLDRDGAPWARWARPVDLLDDATRTGLALLLRSELHRAWARRWADRLDNARSALAGEPGAITRDGEPPVLARLAAVAPYADATVTVDDDRRRRARAVLERWRAWEWQELPDGAGRWSWWFGDGTAPAVVECERWCGLVVDGTWIGWVRGRQDLGPLLGHGLRRVVLLTP